MMLALLHGFFGEAILGVLGRHKTLKMLEKRKEQ